ncbi:MAG: type II toxin-antitoxin system VapC family toxin [Blastocatellia bacterium]
MKYLLDTNVCVNAIHQTVPKLTARFLLVPNRDKVVCSVVRYELFYGAYKSQRRSTSLPIIEAFLSQYLNLDFDESAARVCGELRTDLECKGTPIGPYDLQIAAIALTHNLTLVTHNTREFSRVPNLILEDWET